MAAGTGADVELRFEMFEVLVIAAEERFDGFIRNRDLTGDGGGRNSANSLLCL
jgi:hypothetical protein